MLRLLTVAGAVSARAPVRPDQAAFRDLFEELYAQGVLVRDVSSYPMLERVLRVSAGKPEENDKFLNALDRALETL